MTIIIEQADYRLAVDPAAGGAVRSLSWRDHDILRPAPADARDPLLMASFPLVPFSNRIAAPLHGSAGPLHLPRYMPELPHPIHGFGWQRAWQVAGSSPERIDLMLEDRDSPWFQPYRAHQSMRLDATGFHCSISVENLGAEQMGAGIGLHPYFPRGDCILSIAAGRLWRKQGDVPAQPSDDHPFSNGAVAMAPVRVDHSFSGWDGVAELSWPSRSVAATLTASPTLRELVIYSPDEDYFCIEPVSHLTNAAVATHPELQCGWRDLAPGEMLTGSMTLSARELATAPHDSKMD